MRTRHATHPPAVPMVERAAEGGGGGDLTDGPLDGQTNRGSNPRPRQAPAEAHTKTWGGGGEPGVGGGGGGFLLGVGGGLAGGWGASN